MFFWVFQWVTVVNLAHVQVQSHNKRHGFVRIFVDMMFALLFFFIFDYFPTSFLLLLRRVCWCPFLYLTRLPFLIIISLQTTIFKYMFGKNFRLSSDPKNYIIMNNKKKNNKELSILFLNKLRKTSAASRE